MNIISTLIAAVLGLLVVAFSGLLFAAIVFNLKIGKNYRRKLAADIDKLRLSKMLAALGVDVNAYLHSERVMDIQDQMTRCSNCEQTRECDDRLADGVIEPEKINFCDNEAALLELVEKRKSAGASD